MEQALRAGPVYAAAFLGDGLSDFAAVQPLLMEAGALCHAVRGNNDWGSREELAVSFLVNGVRFYACHGHEWHVKYGLDRLCYAAMECQAQVALYGHAHHAQVDLERGMYLVNPGAVCDRYGVAYAGTSVWRRTAACASAFANGNRKREGVPGWAASACRKSSPAAIFSDRTRFPLRFQRGRGNAQGNLAAQGFRNPPHMSLDFGIQLRGLAPALRTLP